MLTEDWLPNPGTAYGKSKLDAERFLAGYLDSSKHTSTPLSVTPGVTSTALSVTSAQKVIIVRPSMIHGPGNKGNLNLLFKLVQKGFPLTSPNQSPSFRAGVKKSLPELQTE